MKLALFLLAVLGITKAADTLSTDCTCETDYFLSWDSDMRRCLSKTSPHGLSIDNCVEYDFSVTGAEGLVCIKCAPTHAIGKAGSC